MKLIPVSEGDGTGASARVKFICKKCKKQKHPFQMMADIEGKPFDAYYCNNCNERTLNFNDRIAYLMGEIKNLV